MRRLLRESGDGGVNLGEVDGGDGALHLRSDALCA
jgi:hypothetical protein